MNKLGLVIIVIAIAAVGIFALGGNKSVNKNVTPEVSQAEKAAEVTVNITSSGYEPQALTVKAGTKVVWVNKSGTLVTVHSAQHPTHLVYPALNLGQFEDGSSVSLVFDKPGKYFYHNHLTPTQFGNVTVE